MTRHNYAESLKVFHTRLAARAAPYGFTVKGKISTGHITFDRAMGRWEFRSGAEAESFLDGYECALKPK